MVTLKKCGKILKVDIKELDEDFEKLNYELVQINSDINKNIQALNNNTKKTADLGNI